MKRVMALLLPVILLALLLLPVSATAGEAEETVVRVGWFQYPGSSEGHDGSYTGYTYDYLMEIAKYTGWTYEFVEADFAACVEMLAKGEIDLIGGLNKTEEREKLFAYPEQSYGQAYSVLYTVKDSPLQPYDFEGFDGMRIGILKNTLMGELVGQFERDNGFACTVSEYDTAEDIDAALLAQELDAGALMSVVPTGQMRVLAKFAPSYTYIVTTKGNTEVLVGLNRALSYIKINRLYFDAELYQKYYAAEESLELTKEEQALADASQTTPIRVGVLDNCAPISYWNGKENAFEGLAVELLNSICAKTGLQVTYVPTDISRREQAFSPTADSPQLVLGVPLVEGIEDDRGWYLSDSLLQTPLAFVGRSGADLAWYEKEGTVAVVRDFMMAHRYIQEKLPNFHILEYPTIEECMTAVADGRADATIYFQSCILYYLQKPYFSELSMVPADKANTSLCVAGFAPSSEALLGIINKGLGRLSDNELRALTLNSTMLNTYPMTLGDVLYEYRLPLVVIGILLAAVLAALMGLYFVKRRSTEKLNAAYEQKKQALIKAEKASAAKGNFMSRMSHEIRTPLNAVIGYNTIARSELTEAKTDAERRQSEMKVMDCLTKSDVASRHLLTIINDVLDMSAIESGKIQVVNERFDFKGLISSLTTVFYAQAKSKNVEFDVLFDAQMEEWIVGDQMRVNQILTNLLSNAVKFTPDGGRVTLHIHPQTEQSSITLQLTVRDTGIGMTEEYMERIWTPFEQADSSISRRFGGTGLGLSITKTLVDMLGGSIEVSSQPGKGTEFTVTLTFDRTEQPTDMKPYDFSSINALIVDDDAGTCDYIRLLFTRSGVRSSAAYSGEEAVTAVKTALSAGDPYTVCLVDWRMPKMDGLETIRHIRSLAGEELPIIVITAYDFSEVADQAAQLGISRFISKPLFQSSLFNLLANISGGPVPQEEKKLTAYDFAGARVLLTEDNAMNMEIACRILESAKLTVDSAWNGQEAVDVFLAAPAGTYQAILMDVQMPVMDGYQATKLIRASQHPEAATIPIIAITADAFAENIAESRIAGMNDHISKPINLPSLFRVLGKFIR